MPEIIEKKKVFSTTIFIEMCTKGLIIIDERAAPLVSSMYKYGINLYYSPLVGLSMPII